MRNFRCLLFFVLGLAVFSCGTIFAASRPNAAELKRMSVFLSNFTEIGCYDFDLERDGNEDLLHLGDQSNPLAISELIRFGIEHNYVNNPKSTIKQCGVKGCKYGPLTISGKSVAASVRRYFDLPLKNQSVLDAAPECYYDGKMYHFAYIPGTDDAVYYADVQEVSQNGKAITMKGEIYDTKHKEDRPATFIATAKSHKWNGKDTWAILSLRLDFRQ